MKPEDMRALSLTPPWPIAILRCGKRIENRLKWTSCGYRGPVLIHASQPAAPLRTWWRNNGKRRQTDRQHELLCELWAIEAAMRENAAAIGIEAYPEGGPPLWSWREVFEMPGHIVGSAAIVGEVMTSGRVIETPPRRGQLISARDLTEEERRWWMGGFALVLDNVREFQTPVPCDGSLGLWRPTPDVCAQVLREERKLSRPLRLVKAGS